MNAAFSLHTMIPTGRQPDTLPPPSGPRARCAPPISKGPQAVPDPASSPRTLGPSALASVFEAGVDDDDGSYSTIDIPSSDVRLGPILVVLESPATGQTLGTRVLLPGDEITLGASA